MNRPDGHCGAVSSSTASSASGSPPGREIEAPDVLVAGRVPAAARVRVAAALVLVAVDGVGLDRRPHVGDRLLGVAAVGRRERLPLALGRVHRLGEDDALDPGGGRVGGQQVGDLVLERDRERVLLDGRLERAAGRRPLRQDHGLAQGRRRRAGDADGLARHAIGLGGREDVRGREPPRAVDQDADPEALALAGGDAFDPAGLDGDALIESTDDADVGIPGAQGRGRIEGAVGQVSHAPRSLAGARIGCRWGGCPRARRATMSRPRRPATWRGSTTLRP